MKTVHSGWMYSTALLALVVASGAWEKHKTERALKNVFHYSYRITLIDSDTGSVLPISMKAPSVSSSDLFQQTTGTASQSDGSVRLSGVGYLPRTFSFTSDGYEVQRLTIGPDSPFADDIRIKLARTSKGEETKGSQQAAPPADDKPSN